MSNEATVNISLSINQVGGIQYRSFPTSFRADVDDTQGPSPGSFTASITGTDVDLGNLDEPSFCIIQNLDPTNFVSYGIWNGTDFYPLGELLPGEFYLLRLSRELGLEYGGGPGTGSIGHGNSLRVRADTAPCTVVVSAFSK